MLVIFLIYIYILMLDYLIRYQINLTFPTSVQYMLILNAYNR